MKINLKRIDDAYLMEASNESGQKVLADGSKDIGAAETAMRPMQMLISALGGCSAIDVISFLNKMRQPLEDIHIEIQADRVPDEVPSLFSKIHIHYKLFGDIDEKKAHRACELSVDKYCSVGKIIEKTAPITWDVEIIK